MNLRAFLSHCGDDEGPFVFEEIESGLSLPQVQASLRNKLDHFQPLGALDAICPRIPSQGVTMPLGKSRRLENKIH